MAKQNIYLESKPRYEILDGLRGVAALMVIIFHLFETYAHGAYQQTINHGYLAVDFFFILSGFVIGACLFFYGSAEFPAIDSVPGWKFLLCFVMALLMIPAGPKLDIRGWAETNSFNGPNWTLTLEYIGNILYAFIFRRLPTVVLCILSALLSRWTSHGRLRVDG